MRIMQQDRPYVHFQLFQHSHIFFLTRSPRVLRQKPTIGVEFGTKLVKAPNGVEITAQIWDTAGQERYRAITRAHYKRASAALVVYDVSNKRSFEDAKSIWLAELLKFAGDEITGCVMFVGNKIDLETEADDLSEFVSEEDHDTYARQNNLIPMRTSALTGENVDKAFNDLVIRTYNNKKKRGTMNSSKSSEGVSLSGGESGGGKSGGCC